MYIDPVFSGIYAYIVSRGLLDGLYIYCDVWWCAMKATAYVYGGRIQKS